MRHRYINKIAKIFYMSLMLMCYWLPVSAATHYLLCSNNETTFDLVVNTDTPILGFPIRIAPWCSKVFSNDALSKMKCEIDEIEISCVCSSEKAISSLQLSRRSSVLFVLNSYFSDNKLFNESQYSCRPAAKKF
jgi:hypothetical protein